MSENKKKIQAIDYSKKTNWYRIPEITKEFDTFYIYSIMYLELVRTILTTLRSTTPRCWVAYGLSTRLSRAYSKNPQTCLSHSTARAA